MSVSSISSARSVLQQSFQKFKANGGATKDDLTSLQKSLGDSGSSANSKIGDLIDSFTSIDTNNDGKLSADEVKTYTRKSGGGHHCGGRHHVRPPEDSDDTDSSDGISKDDLTNLDSAVASSGLDDDPLKKLIAAFDGSDTDHDGKISASELKAYAGKNSTTATDATQTSSAVDGAADAADGVATTTSTSSDTTSANSIALNLKNLLQAYLNNATGGQDSSSSLIGNVTA